MRADDIMFWFDLGFICWLIFATVWAQGKILFWFQFCVLIVMLVKHGAHLQEMKE